MHRTKLGLTLICFITFHSYGRQKVRAFFQPLDTQTREYIPENAETREQEYQHASMPHQNVNERIKLEMPFLFLAKYVVELQRKPISSLTDTPKYEYHEIRRSYQLTTPGKLIALLTIATLLKTFFKR